ncbi:MAG: hypothetical protein KW806_02725 [Candidatus Yanofskybacteria bacterium]|nr:hypothetical protein [Candidatus Yanofskybacteria bacterium]
MTLSIGEIKTGQDFEEWFFLRRSKGIKNLPYEQFEAGYAEAKRSQGEDWDPLNPKSFGAARLLWGVKEGIRSVTKESNPAAAIYRLVDTRFDYFHGADGSVEYDGERIFFDITINRYKPVRNTVGDRIMIITHQHAWEGKITMIGYYIGLMLLQKKIHRNLRRDASALFQNEDSGMLMT